jgi:type VI secretion system protein ImpH
MATPSRRPAAAVVGADDRAAAGRPLVARLFAEAFAFDFFQAVRLLEKVLPQRRPVGRQGPPRAEIVRFRSLASLSFPASTIHDLLEPEDAEQPPFMIVTFLGLTGPSGTLPHHYTELLMRLQRDGKGAEKYALRDWLDLFNHRLISLFYRAWEKYRFYIPYERGDPFRLEPDAFTRSLLSLVGLGMPALRNRLHVRTHDAGTAPRVLARVQDLAVVYYGGLFARRQRTAVGLQALVQDYFALPAQVRQFQGQWLRLEADNQSRLGEDEHNTLLGVNTVAGERVWDVQSKFRVRLGPLRYAAFLDLLPDRSPVAARKAFFLLCQLVRLYAGAEFDFDVQLVLRGEDVPACLLAADGDGIGARLGWNTWLVSQPRRDVVEDAVFDGEERSWVADNGRPPQTEASAMG